MIGNSDRKQLRQLVQSPQWAAFDLLVKEYCDKIREMRVSNETEWEFIRTSLLREGRELGIQNLMQEIYLQIQNVDESARS